MRLRSPIAVPAVLALAGSGAIAGPAKAPVPRTGPAATVGAAQAEFEAIVASLRKK